MLALQFHDGRSLRLPPQREHPPAGTKRRLAQMRVQHDLGQSEAEALDVGKACH